MPHPSNQLPPQRYACPNCGQHVLPGRVVKAVELPTEGKVLVEYYCHCLETDSLQAKFHPSVSGLRYLFGMQFSLPVTTKPAPLTPDEIDRAVELFAFDVDGLRDADEFDWLCRVSRGGR